MALKSNVVPLRPKNAPENPKREKVSRPEGVYVVVDPNTQGPVKLKKHKVPKRKTPVAKPVRNPRTPKKQHISSQAKPKQSGQTQAKQQRHAPATAPPVRSPSSAPVKPSAKQSRSQPIQKPKANPIDILKQWTWTLSKYALVISALTLGWLGRDTRRLFADEGLGYALGIVGSLLILTLLLYPLRKRYKLLKFIGPVKNWFKTHMILGVVGPLAILYHSNFQLGSLNSTVALVSMLLVASSGLVGRLLYTRIHHGLFGRKKELKELIARVKLTTANPCSATQFVPDLMEKIAEYDSQVMQPPKSMFANFVLPLRISLKTRVEYFRLSRHISRTLKEQAQHSAVVQQHRKRMKKSCKRYVADHLKKVRKVAEFSAYDRLFALWHKVHLPFFILLLITAIIHVIAVHWYAV